jgi:hypothetical protein
MIKKGAVWIKTHYEVQVGIFTLIAARHGTKDAHIMGTVTLGNFQDFLASLLYGLTCNHNNSC